MAINLDGFGYNESVDVTGNKTLTAADSGVVQNVTATATITLPATANALNFLIRNGSSTGSATVTVAPQAADGFTGNGYTATVNKTLSNTNAGDYVWVEGSGTTGVTGYIVTRVRGTWTRQA